MRVGVDARHLAGDRGVAHYTSALVPALAQAFPDDEWRLFLPGRSAVPGHNAAPNQTLVRHALPGRLLFGSAAVLGVPRIDRLLGSDLDVLWMPAPAPLALSRGVPLVLTVHDLSFEQRPRDFTPYERLWHRLARPGRLAGRARRVIVDASPTCEEISSVWPVDPSCVRVVAPGVSPPPAASDESRAAARRRLGVGADYLLAVGALEPRKAPDLLVRAHARARAAGLKADLVFAGRGRLASRLGGPGVQLLGRVTDAELDALYAGALALVFPSWLEGFGLPPLEAAARGTASIVSDLAVYRETLGDDALRFAAGDEQALAQTMLAAARDPSLRDAVAERARARVATMTWENAAQRTHAVLVEAARGG